MKKAIISHKLDAKKAPPLTPELKAQLEALQAMGDKDIDFSDDPVTTEEQWAKAIRNPFYKPVKALTSVRIDADVLDWLKSQGRGYQTRLNTILRSAMIEASSQHQLQSRPAKKGRLVDAK
jgi:uncharacterized protein (DUF4415 family)